ncbi:MAG: TA system VapC family ribonuclease toxin [Microthrixaceae bacterium]
MKVVDANVLLYAVNEDARHHERSRAWLDSALSGGDTVGFSWVVLLAFIRLVTRSDLFERPLSAESALDCVDAWLACRSAVVLEPTAAHLRLVRDLLESVGRAGDVVNDVHLAALAIEHRGVVVSFDRNFERFDGLAWQLPG